LVHEDGERAERERAR
jgi:hypothetical protein